MGSAAHRFDSFGAFVSVPRYLLSAFACQEIGSGLCNTQAIIALDIRLLLQCVCIENRGESFVGSLLYAFLGKIRVCVVGISPSNVLNDSEKEFLGVSQEL